MDEEQRKKLKQLKNMILSHDEKIKAKQFITGEPIATYEKDFIKGEDNKSAKKAALKWAEEYGDRKIQRPEGEIIFNKSGVKKDLGHNIYQDKLDTFPIVPDVYKNGMTLEISDDFDKNPIKNIHIAAPVANKEKNKILWARARQNKGDEIRHYIHHILDPDEIKKMGDTVNTGGSDKSVDLSSSIAHIKNILHDILNVNGDTGQYREGKKNELGGIGLPSVAKRSAMPNIAESNTNIPQIPPDVKGKNIDKE